MHNWGSRINGPQGRAFGAIGDTGMGLSMF